jgi:hypothetical protein
MEPHGTGLSFRHIGRIILRFVWIKQVRLVILAQDGMRRDKWKVEYTNCSRTVLNSL